MNRCRTREQTCVDPNVGQMILTLHQQLSQSFDHGEPEWDPDSSLQIYTFFCNDWRQFTTPKLESLTINPKHSFIELWIKWKITWLMSERS